MPLGLANSTVLYSAAALLIGYQIAVIIYRRFFHPLAKVPGPFLPAVTTLYQTFYNGRYYLEVEKFHKKYGAILFFFFFLCSLH